MSYKHYDGSSWGSEGTAISDAFYWVELARTTDNTIHVASHHQFDYFYTLIWDNPSWSAKNGLTGIRLDNKDDDLEQGYYASYQYAQVFSITPVTTNDSIINKTPLSYGTNRIISGNAPSIYLKKLRDATGMTEKRQNEILPSHVIDVDALKNDDFLSFFEKRKEALLTRIEKVTEKPISRESVHEFDDEQEEEEDFIGEGEQP